MPGGARVESIEAIERFRLVLLKFAEKANNAAGEADQDLARTLAWLEGEAATYWASQLRKAKEQLTRAQDRLKQKQLFKDASGTTPQADEELKLVRQAQARLEYAEGKGLAVKRWTPKLRRELEMYRGNAARFSSALSSDLPAGAAKLDAYVRQLWQYAQLQAGEHEVEQAPLDEDAPDVVSDDSGEQKGGSPNSGGGSAPKGGD